VTTGNRDEAPVKVPPLEVRVRRLHRRDLNRCWEFLVLVFRDVNRETVEYQRPRSKKRFCDIYEEDEAEQLLFEVDGEIVGYAECTFEIGSGSDNWLNPRYFENRNMRPMFVEELAVHPRMQGRGVGGFMIDQLQHLARLRGCTHLVLEVAENNRDALAFYRHRNFQKMDAAIFMAQKIESPADLLPPRRLKGRVDLDLKTSRGQSARPSARNSAVPKKKRGENGKSKVGAATKAAKAAVKAAGKLAKAAKAAARAANGAAKLSAPQEPEGEVLLVGTLPAEREPKPLKRAAKGAVRKGAKREGPTAKASKRREALPAKTARRSGKKALAPSQPEVLGDDNTVGTQSEN
jgi:ribosomal protein S18 acetylase RimI-like enzyme